jgi:hypothetical protein
MNKRRRFIQSELEQPAWFASQFWRTAEPSVLLERPAGGQVNKKPRNEREDCGRGAQRPRVHSAGKFDLSDGGPTICLVLQRHMPSDPCIEGT